MNGPHEELEILTRRQPLQWVEFGWLWLTDRRFRAARDKRKAYFEHLMVKRGAPQVLMGGISLIS